MAKILQVLDIDSAHYKLRLDDGRLVFLPHSGNHPAIGDEYVEITDGEKAAQRLKEIEAGAELTHEEKAYRDLFLKAVEQDAEIAALKQQLAAAQADLIAQNQRMNADRDKEALAYSERIRQLEADLALAQAKREEDEAQQPPRAMS